MAWTADAALLYKLQILVNNPSEVVKLQTGIVVSHEVNVEHCNRVLYLRRTD